MIRLSWMIGGAFAGLAACQTAPTPTEVADGPPPPPETAVVLGALESPSMRSGECGMILWTLDENRPAPVFRYVSGKKGAVSIRGRTIELTLVETSGAGAFGVYERQTFAGPEGLKVDVATRFGLGFDGGSYLESGVVAVESAEGWRAVSPSAGIAGCRS